MMNTRKAYGSWETSFTAEKITESSVTLSEVCLCEKTVYWLETRPNENRCVVVRYLENGLKEDAIPTNRSARTLVHEYGGGSWLPLDKERVLYSNFCDQRLYCNEKAITPEPPIPASWRYADGCYHNNFYFCVYEVHHEDRTVTNSIARIALDDGEISVLVKGADFYACPRVGNSNKLAYLSWDHPNMPWDATIVSVQDLETGIETVVVSGDMVTGRGSFLQLAWSSQNDLYYISDSTKGWYGLYAWNGREACTVTLKEGVDLGDPAPGWKLGQRCYDIAPDGTLLFARPDANGATRLVWLSSDGEKQIESDELPLYISNVRVGPSSNDDDDRSSVLFLGSSPDDLSWVGLVTFNKATGKPFQVTRLSSFLGTVPDRHSISKPQIIEFPTTDQAKAYAYYYPPQNSLFCGGLKNELPPLLVKSHGGPTAAAQSSFSPKIQFWTSRGFAVVDVDYRGSTGYGTDYRHALRSKWGIYDVDDVCAAALYLIEKGLVDPQRIAISGGSAGGYTVLGALAWKSIFKAGCCQYGIGDLRILARETHKFESQYLDRLVGGVLPKDEALFKERAPIESVDQLDCPVLFLHGEEDKIVPPSQAVLMHSALKAKGVPTALKLYPNEQHGFRNAINIIDTLNSELYFYSRIFKFDLPSSFYQTTSPFSIDNLDSNNL